MKRPKEAFVVNMKVTAHDRASLLRALDEMRGLAEQGVRGSVGGCAGGGWHHFRMRHDPEMTRDRYREEIAAYFEAKREKARDA